MHVSVMMRFWLQFLGLITCLRHLVLGVTSQAETTKINLPYSGMRRAYTQMHMPTATEAKTLDAGIGSNGVHSTPRRGEERIETLPSESDCDTCATTQAHGLVR